jgi:hypothetical protein
MKTSLLSFALVLASSLTALCDVPVPGYYLGTVTITKGLGPEGLQSSVTLRSQARVANDGTITILNTVREIPTSVGNVDRSVSRVAPVTAPQIVPTTVADPFSEPVVNTAVNNPFAGFAYAVDGLYGADLTMIGRLLSIDYQLTADIVANGPVSVNQVPDRYTLFNYRLLKMQ